MALKIELAINGSTDSVVRYLTWTPYLGQLRLADADNAVGPVTVVLRNAAANVGQLLFRDVDTEDGESETTRVLPVDGSPVELLISGELQYPSVDDGDAVLEAVVDGAVVARVPFMVRIRKDAETLTERERDRFVSAFAKLNKGGTGLFSGFYAMHTEDTTDEAHGLDGFLPWHRAYLLDLERQLQFIDPAVALPYWRFDRPAPRLFSADFLGAPAGPPSQTPLRPTLSAANPLRDWQIDGRVGFQRHPRFADPRMSAATWEPGRTVVSEELLLDYARTQNLDYAYPDGVSPQDVRYGFRDYLEGDPHGSAHTSFAGLIRVASTAAADPLFFLLHCNVDRIWAQWQWHEERFDGEQANTYFYRSVAGTPGGTRIGHNLGDTMWPWNGDTTGLRPPSAPRAPLLGSPVVTGPPATPTVGDLIDFQGQTGIPPCGFDYDDVPFQKRI